MSGMLLLDSDVLIDLLRKRPTVLARLQAEASQGRVLATTTLNVAEVLRGAHRSNQDLELAGRVLSGMVEIPLGPRAARRFARTMRGLDEAGQTIPTVDGLIAAIALEENATVATRNGKHFERVPNLELLVF